MAGRHTFRMKLNWNTLILSAGFSLLSFLGREMYSEVRSTHDAVLLLKGQVGLMTPRADFDIQLTEVRARLSQVELDIQKLKEKKQ